MCVRIYIVDKEIVQHRVVSVKCVMLVLTQVPRHITSLAMVFTSGDQK